ncbi:C2H2 zinc finger protein [Ectocarpus siliculosus]|uniref:C2H2 zinc finger protein n=1 Tax=Ectocarpus siliculosus TaxID=2880 RepID=D7G1D9_ECTSI|nr:C2H2 zinc finger protein [Ectocarpus siliculosus]|eukprot:CBJ33249.1 C2H2 zinc finger protein [Ectocarpus siliculosus]
MSLSNPLSHGLLKDLGKLSELKQRGLILDRHFETIKAHVKAGNSVAKERWDAIENAWGLMQTGVFNEEEWITQIDGEAQGISTSTRPSFLTPQDAGGARGAPSSHPPPATAAAAGKRKVADRGKQVRNRAAQGVLGGNIINAFARGSGKPIERTRGGVTEHVSGINFPPPAPERRLPCTHCPMTFVNEQGLGIHVKTQHSNANMSNSLRLQRMLGKTPKGHVQPWEEAGPGRCWHVKVDGARGAASFVLQRKRFRDLDLESDGFTDRKVKETRGAVKRKRYDYRFKAHVVTQLRLLQEDAADLFKEEKLTPLQYLEDRLKVNYSLIVKWAQDEANIVQSAADDVKKTLLAKQQPKRWFPEEEKKLHNMFLARRRRKLKVSTLWLTVTFRKLVQENHPEDQRAAAFSASFRWARKWAKRHKLSKRRRSNLKNKSVEERLPKIQRFHRRFRKLLQEPVRYRAPEASDVSAMSTVAEGESRDPKYGQFQLWERWNVDQVPLPFVNGLISTWEKTGALRVAISQPFAGLEKRQCTMQVIFGPGEKTMRISVIFRGQGKRISPVEKAAYHKDVDVFFQQNAWADQKFCMEWAKRSYREGLIRGRGELPKARSILIMDNLHAQTTDEFKGYLAKQCNTLAWLGPAECTDEVQPVDAGAGRFLKVEVGNEMDKWLDQSDNIERWETASLTASDRRVLITQWAGAAMEKLNSNQGYRHRLFEKCGMAMTVDGSGDDRITLEGLDQPYTFANDEDSSENEGGSEDGSDGPEGKEEEGAGRREPVVGDERNGANSGEGMEGAGYSDEDDDNMSQSQTDELALLDEDDSMDPDDPEDETQGMEIPAGFRLQEFTPAALDRLLLQRGVLVRLGMGWFGGLIIQQSPQRHLYDYCVQLEVDHSTRKMKLPLDKYSGDPDAAVGSWVLLESVSRAGRVRTPNVTLVDQDG